VLSLIYSFESQLLLHASAWGQKPFLLKILLSVVHLEWSFLADLHGSDDYPVNPHISTTNSQVF
jgi:hypothetical protein